MKTTLINVQGKGPEDKVKSGKFEVSAWHWKKIIPASEENRDVFAERQVDVYRACIRYKQWNRSAQAWDEKLIWCDIDDLRDLALALDGFNINDEEVGE